MFSSMTQTQNYITRTPAVKMSVATSCDIKSSYKRDYKLTTNLSKLCGCEELLCEKGKLEEMDH